MAVRLAVEDGLPYRVLDHDPTHDDIREFFTAFREALNLRGLVLRGITTDASPLYPGPISAIFPGVPHQVGKTLSKLFSPNLEKALTFLDDSLLPATSSAVERGNRRHRKMQKTVYRVRSRHNIHARIAIDMLRDAQATGRFETTRTLHHARAG